MDTSRKPGSDGRPGPGYGEDRPTIGEALRGIWAVMLLFLTGIDALVTALIGVRPLAPILNQLGHVIADEYRAGRHGYHDADVIDDPESEMEP